MADSAPKVAEKERREPQDVVDGKAQELVDEIKRSKHFIAFTGAGISTSAGEFPSFNHTTRPLQCVDRCMLGEGWPKSHPDV